MAERRCGAAAGGARTAPTARVRPRPARGGERRACLQLDLALQGGGAHGAFTWGVLDRLLQEEDIEIAAVSGTSAGAMNAVALAAGLMEGGRDGARAALDRFWTAVARAAPFSAAPPPPWAAPWLAPWQAWTQAWAQTLSPYQFNPLNLNPLRRILRETVDFGRVRGCSKTQLFIAATDVASGALRVFAQHELTEDMVLASACLPLLFQAVEVGGAPCWDGGYAGNPTLLPLVTDSLADDLLLVQINPDRRDGAPTTSRDILERINEITFNTALMKELRTLALLRRALAQTQPAGAAAPAPWLARVQALRTHRLDGGARLAAYGAGSKLRTDEPFLRELQALGVQAADDWLRAHRAALGTRSSFDLDGLIDELP